MQGIIIGGKCHPHQKSWCVARHTAVLFIWHQRKRKILFCSWLCWEPKSSHHLFVGTRISSKAWKGVSVWDNTPPPDMIFKSRISLGPRRAGECCAYIPSTSHADAIFSAALYGYLTSWCLSGLIERPFRGPAVWQCISDVICVLINGELNFQVVRPTVAAQCERLQEGYLSLAARWPEAKSAEEPRSLNPLTRMWTKVAGYPPPITLSSMQSLKGALLSVNLIMIHLFQLRGIRVHAGKCLYESQWIRSHTDVPSFSIDAHF